jgi:hypothetical protein
MRHSSVGRAGGADNSPTSSQKSKVTQINFVKTGDDVEPPPQMESAFLTVKQTHQKCLVLTRRNNFLSHDMRNKGVFVPSCYIGSCSATINYSPTDVPRIILLLLYDNNVAS